MSKIQEALKRAQDAQQKTPGAASGPELQPLAPLSPSPRGIGMILPMFVVLFVFLSFIFVWQTRQQVSASQPKDKIQPPTAVAALAPKPPVPATHVTQPATNTKPAVVVVAAPVLQPVPKLQAIFFAPGHSTAIIGGKTVRAGDALGNFRIAAITQSSVTVFSYTQTNVLVLKQ
jgi:hypothetical protein